jgi:hypothetical protein
VSGSRLSPRAPLPQAVIFNLDYGYVASLAVMPWLYERRAGPAGAARRASAASVASPAATRGEADASHGPAQAEASDASVTANGHTGDGGAQAAETGPSGGEGAAAEGPGAGEAPPRRAVGGRARRRLAWRAVAGTSNGHVLLLDASLFR